MGSAVLSLGTFVLVTHGTDVYTAGVYISAVSYATLLFGFLDFGTGPVLVRQAAQGNPQYRITVYVWTRAVLTVVVLGVGAVGAIVLFPGPSRTAAFISLGYVASSIYSVAGPVGQVIGSARAFRRLAWFQGLTVFASILLVLSLTSRPSPDLLVGAYSASAGLAAVGALVWVRRMMVQVPARTVFREVLENLRSVMVLGVATGAGSIYFRIDQSLVLHYRGAGASALYGLAARIAMQARLIPSAVQLSISSFLAHRLHGEGRLSDQEARLVTRIEMGTGLGLAFVVISLADAAVYVLGGTHYGGAVLPTVIMGISLVSTSYNYVVATGAIMAGRDRLYLRVTASALVLNVAANVLLLPRYGLTAGAVVATVTEFYAVMAIAEAVGPNRGAAKRSTVLLTLLVATVAGIGKMQLTHLPLILNASGSVALFGAGCGFLWSGYVALRHLPSFSRPDGERLSTAVESAA